MSATDYTRLLEKIVPKEDGEDPLRLRTATVTVINSDGTVDITLSGVTVEDVPVVGSNLGLVVGRTVQVLVHRGDLLVLGQTAGSAATANPSAFATFGTPTFTTGNITAITPSAVTVDDGDMYPGSGSTFTIPSGQGGLYEIGMVVRYASQAVAAGVRQARINVNGSEYIINQIPTTAGLNASNIIVNLVARRVMTAGDTVTFLGFQSSGGDLALTGNSHGWIERVR